MSFFLDKNIVADETIFFLVATSSQLVLDCNVVYYSVCL